MLSVRHLSKFFSSRSLSPTPILSQIRFDLSPGEVLVLLGPNGAGKTTLLKILATIICPDEGTVRWGPLDWAKSPERARSLVGWVPSDDRSFYPRLSPEENLVFFSALRGISARETRRRLAQMEEEWGMVLPRGKTFQLVSSGYKRWTALYRALLHDPSLLLLDEPTQHLDPLGAERFRSRVIRHFVEGSARAVIWVSHNLLEAYELKKPIGLLRRGMLTCEGTPGERWRSVAELQAFYLEKVGAP